MGRTGIYACGESVSRCNSLESVVLFSLKQEAPASIGGSTFTNNLIISRYKKGLPHSDSPFFTLTVGIVDITLLVYVVFFMHLPSCIVCTLSIRRAARWDGPYAYGQWPCLFAFCRTAQPAICRLFPSPDCDSVGAVPEGGPLRAEGFPKRRCRLESVAA